jgi:hypothetical protein
MNHGDSSDSLYLSTTLEFLIVNYQLSIVNCQLSTLKALKVFSLEVLDVN